MLSDDSTHPLLQDLLRAVGRTLVEGHPIELAIGNIVRRVLFIVRLDVSAPVHACMCIRRREFATASAEEKEGKAGDKSQQKDAVLFRLCIVVLTRPLG